MTERFQYAAFISYSSDDDTFARRLHRALEHYGIPTSLGKFDLIGDGKKNRIYPVFRDREELAARGLQEQIDAALKASAALIVVCSPNSVASQWVKHEIDVFLNEGRGERVFAIIAGDAPVTDDAGTDATARCIPPALRGDISANPNALTLLAADARQGKDGFRNAWLKIVAGIINVAPGQIIDRDRKRRRQRRRSIGLAAAAAAAIGLTALAWVDTQIWRTRLSSYAENLASQGRPRDAAPFALGGVPAPGALLPAQSDRADATLVRTSSLRLAMEFGELQNFQISADGAFLVIFGFNGSGTLYDLAALRAGRDGLTNLAHVIDYVDNILLSADGAVLVVQGIAGNAALYDLAALRAGRDGAFTLGNLGYLRESQLSGDGALLFTVDISGAGTLYDLTALRAGRDGRTFVGDFGLSSDYWLTNDGAQLIVWANARGAIYDLAALRRSGARPVDLGVIDVLLPSADGAILFVRQMDGGATLFDRSEFQAGREVGTFLGDLSAIDDFVLSADGATLVGLESDYDGVLYDLAAIRAGRAGRIELGNLGDLGDTASLGPKEFQLSANGAFLITRRQDTRGTLHDLVTIRAARPGRADLGDLEDFRLSANGAELLVKETDAFGTLYDLTSPVWQGATPPTGAALARAVCRANGDWLRPFPISLRANAGATGIETRSRSADDDRILQSLRGRPWNPCDWRGLGAGTEGLRQWWRLVQVRFNLPGARDYSCGEINADGATTPHRLEACRLAEQRAAAASEAE